MYTLYHYVGIYTNNCLAAISRVATFKIPFDWANVSSYTKYSNINGLILYKNPFLQIEESVGAQVISQANQV